MRGDNPLRPQDLSDGQRLWVQEVFYTLQGEGPFAGQPAVLLVLAGALNGLILPITLGVCLIASQKKSVMGEDYHHPVLLLVLGIVVVVVSGYLGITSLSSLSALFA